jgi:NadR type nicotinamide-nucleotide adenylyltransferase
MIRKVVAVGPESTGKSTLCQQLARHYNSAWCPEYARKYLLEHGKNYSYEDLLLIAEGQIALEDECVAMLTKKNESNRANPASESMTRDAALFIDTDMYVMKIWCEFVFGRCHPFILEQIAKRTYDLYLLCNIDLEWTRDELREYPDIETRQRLYQVYRETMRGQLTPCVEISGTQELRLQQAVDAVDKLLNR